MTRADQSTSLWRAPAGRRTAPALCLLAAILGRLVPALLSFPHWTASSCLAGYWVWIVAMLAAAIGFGLLALMSDHHRSEAAGSWPATLSDHRIAPP